MNPERFFRQTKAETVTGVKAAYALIHDRIGMPPFACFDDAPGLVCRAVP